MCFWVPVGERKEKDGAQGDNFVPGNRYPTDTDRHSADAANGGNYIIVERTAGKEGGVMLAQAAREAIATKRRLLGFFGDKGGHLPFATADGNYDPTIIPKQAVAETHPPQPR